MPDFNAIKNAPDVSFIDGKTIEQVENEMVSDYEKFMSDTEGKEIKLGKASPHRMILLSSAAQIYQAMQYIDRAGKQNLLKYSYSEFLDNLALFKGVTRLPAESASATFRFTLSAERSVATGIPKGTRIANDDGVFFATEEYAEIPAGTLTVETLAKCTVAGKDANGIAIGEIKTIVDPVPYIATAANINATAGGSDIETDEDLAERIYLAPSAYSTAGPEDSYKYHAKRYNASIGDVVATSDQQAGTVDITFIMADGSTPDTSMINGLKDYLNDKSIRPMTDIVNVAAPAEIGYTIALTYYINQSDSAQAVAIQNAVDKAVSDYLKWQRSIGRDINPSKLTALIMAAGAKRVELTAPSYKTVGATSVSKLNGDPSVNYGGLEND